MPPLYVMTDLVFGAIFVAAFILILGKRGEIQPLHHRMQSMDFVKGAAMITVVMVHVGTIVTPGRALDPFIGSGVELFILASGYLLARRYANSLDLRTYFGKIFFRIVLIYALFVIAVHIVSNGFSLSFPDLLMDFALGRSNGSGYYFIPVILQFYIAFPLMRALGKKVDPRILLVLLFLACAYWTHLDSQMRKPAWDSNPHVLAFFGRYIFFFALGLYMAPYELSNMGKKKLLAVAAIYIAGAAAVSFATNDLFLGNVYAVFAFIAIYLAYREAGKSAFGKKLAAAVAAIGAQSLLIYLFHAMILYGIVARFAPKLPDSVAYVLFTIATLALSYAASLVFMKAYWKATGFNAQA